MFKNFIFLLLFLLGFAIYGCSSSILARHVGVEISPEAFSLDKKSDRKFLDLSNVKNVDEWEDIHVKSLRNLFSSHLYGPVPQEQESEIRFYRKLEAHRFADIATISEYRLNNQFSDQSVLLDIAIVWPKKSQKVRGVIVAPSFCSNRKTLGLDQLSEPSNWYPKSMCDSESPLVTVASWVFGKYIFEVPVEKILSRGYAVALFQSNDAYPDQEGLAVERSDKMRTADKEGPIRAIAAWSWGYSKVIDILQQLQKVDPKIIALYGHSRQGKAVLHNCAFDGRAGLIFAHQSGTGGATLSRSLNGESIGSITESYPHWFADHFSQFEENEAALPVDQHQLIALCAPSKILFGNAQRDVWSDPIGAFQAAKMAAPIYRLYGSDGLRQKKLGATDYEADLSFFLRKGLHGSRGSDWDAFLNFMDAHLK